jgi:hypothetical protein
MVQQGRSHQHKLPSSDDSADSEPGRPRDSDGPSALMALRDRVLSRAARAAPGPIAASIDGLRIGLADEFGGPFNGQEKRIEAIREIFARVQFGAIIETGTYRATTTVFLRSLSNAPIATIEAKSRYYHYAKRRLRGVARLAAIRGDSATLLPQLARIPPWSLVPVFFYLDAHWLKALPLPAELEAIRDGWSDFVALIDDFRVPDDPGYAYDDYGPGAVLEPEILTPLADSNVAVYWPVAPSATETGARRGWVVLASAGPVDDALQSLRTLRRAGSVPSVIAANGSRRTL